MREKKEKTPLGTILVKYVHVWRVAWSQRHEMAPLKRDRDAMAFLPAHLELVETPVSAAPRWVARLIILLTLIALVWAYWGQLDIVAVAQGKTVVNGHSKQIQPLESAVVEEINVENGQVVKTGDVLVTLSVMGAEADFEGAKQLLKNEQFSHLRHSLFLKALEKGSVDFSPTGMLPKNDVKQAVSLASNQFKAWKNEDEAFAASLKQRIAEKSTLKLDISGLESLLSIENQRLTDLNKLYKKDFVSKHSYLEQKRKTLELSQELRTKNSQLKELDAAIAQVKENRALKRQILKSEALNLQQKAQEKIDEIKFSIKKTEQRQQLMTLTSPVDGTVQQLTTHTLGGVVTAAQPIMVIVPDSNELQVEVMVANKDIGFVSIGQEAIIKIESFPYTRYGYLIGHVKSVTFDAIEHEQLGLVYAATITLKKTQLNINGNEVKLTAGMNVTAEIKTGKRRVIDYLLSPLQTKIDESFIER